MKKYTYVLILVILFIASSAICGVNLYMQNDTKEPIEFERNVTTPGMSRLMAYRVEVGQRKPTPSELLESIYARYENDGVFRKLNLGNALKDAQKEGISSIIHIVPGTWFGLKVGKIDKVTENIEIPLNDKMKVLMPLGLTLREVDVPKFDRVLAAKILGIAAASGKQQVEAAYKDLAVQDRGKTDNIASYRGYLLTKALRAFES